MDPLDDFVRQGGLYDNIVRLVSCQLVLEGMAKSRVTSRRIMIETRGNG